VCYTISCQVREGLNQVIWHGLQVETRLKCRNPPQGALYRA